MAKFRCQLTEHGLRLDQVVAQVEGTLPPVQRANADDLQATARRLVHRRTGQTAESLELVPQGPLGWDLVGAYGAQFEEYGTRYRPPHPFAAPAASDVQARALDRVRAAVEAVIT